MSTPNEQTPDLAERIVDIHATNAGGLSDLECAALHETIRAELAASSELAQVREALEKAMLETTPAIPYDFGIPAVADACREALAALDRLTGKTKP